MIRLLKLSILAAILAVPFWPVQERLRIGSKAFVASDRPFTRGTRVVVLGDSGTGSVRYVVVKVDMGGPTGNVGEIRRADLCPIDPTIGGDR